MLCLTHLHAALWVNEGTHDGAGAQGQAVGQLVNWLQLGSGEERLQACSSREGLQKKFAGKLAGMC
jgi:hypothetical protein